MNVIEKAQEVVESINKQMIKYETCKTILEIIKEKDIVFDGGTKVIFLDGVLNKEQQENLKAQVIQAIENNKQEAAVFLTALSPEPIIETKIVAPDKNVVSKQREEEGNNADSMSIVLTAAEEKPKEIILDYDEVKKLYTMTDRSLVDVAKELGVSKTRLHSFITKNFLKRPRKAE